MVVDLADVEVVVSTLFIVPVVNCVVGVVVVAVVGTLEVAEIITNHFMLYTARCWGGGGYVTTVPSRRIVKIALCSLQGTVRFTALLNISNHENYKDPYNPNWYYCP